MRHDRAEGHERHEEAERRGAGEARRTAGADDERPDAGSGDDELRQWWWSGTQADCQDAGEGWRRWNRWRREGVRSLVSAQLKRAGRRAGPSILIQSHFRAAPRDASRSLRKPTGRSLRKERRREEQLIFFIRACRDAVISES